MAVVVRAQDTVTPPSQITEAVIPLENDVELPPKEIVDIDEPLTDINPITLQKYEQEKAIALAKGAAMADEDGEESPSEGNSEFSSEDDQSDQDEFERSKAAWRHKRRM